MEARSFPETLHFNRPSKFINGDNYQYVSYWWICVAC